MICLDQNTIFWYDFTLDRLDESQGIKLLEHGFCQVITLDIKEIMIAFTSLSNMPLVNNCNMA